MSGGDWKEMLVAVQDGNIDLVKYHIKEGIDLNYEHPELMTTPLIECIQYNRLEIAKLLLENGADPLLNAWLSNENPVRLAKQQKKKEFSELFKAYRKPTSLLDRLFKRS